MMNNVTVKTSFRNSLPVIQRCFSSATDAKEWEAAKPYEDIPGPKALPIIGNVWRFLPIAGKYYVSVKEMPNFMRKYGIIAKIDGLQGNPDVLGIFDPAEIEKIYRREGKFPERSSAQFQYYYRTITRKDRYANVLGLLSTQGDEWYQFRSKVNSAMMKPANANMYIPAIEKVAEEFLQRIEKLKDKNQEMPDDFSNELKKWGLETIAMIALDSKLGSFSDKISSDTQKMIENANEILNLTVELELFPLWKIYSTKSWKKYVQINDEVYEYCMNQIDKALKRTKEEKRETNSILEILAAIDPKIATVMAMDMLSAGIDTTSTAVSVIIYVLSKNLDKQEILFEELKRVLPNPNDNITVDKLEEMKYLKAVIKEGMRVRPIIIGLARLSTQDMVISGYRVPKGKNFFFPMGFLCKSEKYFENPDKFIPERWLKHREQKNITPFTYMPFGHGARMCIGKRFADLEMEILIAKIFRNFEVRYNYGEAKMKQMLINTISSPLKFQMIRRQQ